jgi:hypothetical protein
MELVPREFTPKSVAAGSRHVDIRHDGLGQWGLAPSAPAGKLNPRFAQLQRRSAYGRKQPPSPSILLERPLSRGRVVAN